MHLRKGSTNQMSVTIQEDLTKAHAVKKPCEYLVDLTVNSESTPSAQQKK